MMSRLSFRPSVLLGPLLALAILGGCAGDGPAVEAEYPDPDMEDLYRYGSLLGEDRQGFSLLGPRRREDAERGGGIGVNSFLWRASLDTIAFMPVASADPFGGVILTDWHSPAGSPNERFKVNLYILDRQLRADGLRAAVFRQVRDDAAGEWRDAPVAPETVTQLEDAILTRARELRIAQAPAAG